MKQLIKTYTPILLAFLLCILFGVALLLYSRPMKDVSYDLSLISKSAAASSAEAFDEKGWTVYLQEGDSVTYLESDGRGFYLGLDLGQTFYFSRVLTEEMDNPTLQLGTDSRTFVVFLEEEVIYTDWPEQDSRIGYLNLPMNSQYRQDPITITLPPDYLGKTLTIAQSTPPYAEGSVFKAAPASVMLYCGYAYESGLIAETYSLAIGSGIFFVIGVLLLLAFIRRKDYSFLFIALTAFFSMTVLLTDASFRYRYFGITFNFYWYTRWFAAINLAAFLSLQAGRLKLLPQLLTLGGILITPVSLILTVRYPDTIHPAINFLRYDLPEYLGFILLLLTLVLAWTHWRKEKRFYRIYAPLTLAGIAVTILLILSGKISMANLSVSLASGHVIQIYQKLLTVCTASALFSALLDALLLEWEYHLEKRMLKEHRDLALSGYESLKCQQEEIMMLRHDMLRHFHTLHDMPEEARRTEYLAALIERNEKIRPIVTSGNNMLDIILNGRLGEAVNAGITPEIVQAEAPAVLPLSDPDLCALLMNILDNAIAAAAASEAPKLRINIHPKDGYFTITCENSLPACAAATETKKENTQKHGFGLKIIQAVTKHYEGVFVQEQDDHLFRIKIVLPLS